jgi:hypothetical protein
MFFQPMLNCFVQAGKRNCTNEYFSLTNSFMNLHHVFQTDTASVLFETIKYIKFLHEQVQVNNNTPNANTKIPCIAMQF